MVSKGLKNSKFCSEILGEDIRLGPNIFSRRTKAQDNTKLNITVYLYLRFQCLSQRIYDPGQLRMSQIRLI